MIPNHISNSDDLYLKYLKKDNGLIPILLISVFLFFGHINQNMAIYFCPLLLSYSFVCIISRRIHSWRITIADIVVVLLLFSETINYFFSSYRPNSFLFFEKFMFFIVTYYFIRVHIKSNNQNKFFILFIIIISCYFSYLTISSYIIHKSALDLLNFNDYTEFRYLFGFSGYPANEWITIFFFFLPFTFIFYIVYRSHEILKYPALAIVLLNINAIQISFSRGALIALVSFFIVLNTLVLKYRLINIRELVKINLFIFILSTLLITPYFKTALNELKFYKSTSQVRSISGRLNTVESALHIFKGNKITGVGSFNFPINNVKFKGRQDDIVFTSKLPNSLLQILVEKGIIGFISYLVLFGVFLLISLKLINRTKLNKLYGVFSCLLFSTCVSILIKEMSFSSIFSNTLVLIFLGVIGAFIINLYNQSKNKEYRFNNTVVLVYCSIVLSYSIFIMYRHISYAKAEEFNCSYINALKEENFLEAQQLINQAIEIEPENALFQANRGLINERRLKLTIFPDSFILNEPSLLCKSIIDTLKDAVEFYKKAAVLNPGDESFYHNIAWNYMLLNETDSARFYFNKCTKIESSIAIYHISFGIFYEKLGQIEKACDEYRDAVRLSPDILDSRFFCDFQERHPYKSNFLIQRLIEELKKNSETNIIIRSRLAKLLMNAGKKDTALLLFKNITTEMPNLNRPWYYFAQLARGFNKENIELYFHRAYYLDRNDYLPSYELANLFFEQGKYELAKNQYLLTLKNWQNSYSIHSQRARNMYLSLAPNNDIVPEFLVNYIKPTIDINLINERLKRIRIINKV